MVAFLRKRRRPLKAKRKRKPAHDLGPEGEGVPIERPATAARKRAKQATLLAKRKHRELLGMKAETHWKTIGAPERAAYMAKVRAALEAEGFRSTPFQWRHKGHAFGLVKQVGRDKQIHVRVYDNGIIDAEIELHKRYLEHIFSPRPSAHKAVQKIFLKHQIPLDLINEHYLPKVGAHRRAYPKGRTKVAHIMGGAAGIMGSVVAVSVARLALRALKRRAL